MNHFLFALFLDLVIIACLNYISSPLSQSTNLNNMSEYYKNSQWYILQTKMKDIFYKYTQWLFYGCVYPATIYSILK